MIDTATAPVKASRVPIDTVVVHFTDTVQMHRRNTFKSCLVEPARTGASSRRYTVRTGRDATLRMGNVVQTLNIFLAKVIDFARNG